MNLSAVGASAPPVGSFTGLDDDADTGRQCLFPPPPLLVAPADVDPDCRGGRRPGSESPQQDGRADAVPTRPPHSTPAGAWRGRTPRDVSRPESDRVGTNR